MTSFLNNKSEVSKSTGKKKALRRARTLSETKNWYKDRYQTVVVQRNFVAIIALLTLVVVALCIWWIQMLNAKKTFEPYVIEIEEKSGIVTQVRGSAVQKYRDDEVVVRSLLVQYIKAREGFDPYNFRYNYNQVVRLMSSGEVYNDFLQTIHTSNPDSPVNLAQEEARRVVGVKSISFLSKKEQKVQIRLALDDVFPRGKLTRQNAIITLNYKFKNLNLTEKERYINPLGFQITAYSLDKEYIDEGS